MTQFKYKLLVILISQLLTPKSDQHLTSPYNITPESHFKIYVLVKWFNP